MLGVYKLFTILDILHVRMYVASSKCVGLYVHTCMYLCCKPPGTDKNTFSTNAVFTVNDSQN